MTRFDPNENTTMLMFYRQHEHDARNIIGYDYWYDGYYLFYTSDGKRLIWDSHNSANPPQNFRREIDPDRMTDDDIKQELAMRLKRKMWKNSGMTQTKLSELTGIPQPMIHRYFTGQRIPSIVNLRKIARALNCKISDLTGIE